MFRKLLVATDLSEESLAAVATAGRLARSFDAEVTLVYSLEDRLPPALLGDEKFYRRVREEHTDQARAALTDAAATYLHEVTYHTAIREGRPHREILALAREEGADLIVLASRGHGLLGSALLGSTAERVLHKASCPVLVVPLAAEEGP